MSIWLIMLIGIISIIVITTTILFFIQERMLFHPEKLPLDYVFFFNQDFKEINLETEDGNNLNGIFFKTKNPKGVIYYLHNHSGNVEHWSRAAFFFNNFGYDVLIVDYRGYGKSTGNIKEELLCTDSLQWYDYLKNIYKEDQITIYGRGIGATFGTYVASKRKPNMLLLESPVFNLVFVANFHYPYIPVKKWFIKFQLDTATYIKDVKCKIYIFHGKKNELVNYKNSVKLYQLVKHNTDLILVPEANHFNLINSKPYLKTIREIL